MEDGLNRFFAFSRERHAVYLRRRAGRERPWTTDPVISKYRFTNIFRELDRTTIWFRENVRDHYTRDPACILATLVFRLFNRISTAEFIFKQGDFIDGSPFEALLAGWRRGEDPHKLTKDLGEKIRRAIPAPGPYVTGAYIIKTPEGMTKLDGVLWIIAEAMRGELKARSTAERANPTKYASLLDWGRYMLETNEPLHLETAVAWLERLPFIGHFTAYEIVTDLRHTALLDRAPDIMTWANPGPGCRRGIKRVVGGDKRAYIGNDAQILDRMREVLEASRSVDYWPQPDKLNGEPAYTAGGAAANHLAEIYHGPLGFAQGENDWPAWEMRDVEHTLCEYDKMERARLGEGRPRGTI